MKFSPRPKHFFLFTTLPFAYLLICIFMFVSQRHLMYFPRVTTELSETTWKKVFVNNNLVGVESLDDNPDTVIIFHGNVGNANMRNYYFNLMPKNYHVVVAEYPGFGLKNDTEITKDNILSDARKLVTHMKGKTKGNIALVGESLGTGIASQMAKEFDVKKLMLITPYSSIADVAQSRYWYLPVSWLIKDNFNSVENLAKYNGQTLIMISEKDQVIPPQFAEKLYSTISGKKEKMVIVGASHSGWLKNMTQEQVNKVKVFLQ